MKINVDNAYVYFAADSLLKRQRKLTRRIDAVRKGPDESDIEPVHKMRVAARRLRAGLTIFKEQLVGKQRKRWQKMVKDVRSSLGTARDLDVQIQFLKKFIRQQNTQGCRPTVEIFSSGFGAGQNLQGEKWSDLKSLLEYLRRQRKDVQPHLVAIMDELENNPILREMEITLKVIRSSAREGMMGKPAATSGIYDEARKLAGDKISSRMEKFLTFKPYVVMPDAHEQHHKMRIAGKKLRYTMEVFKPLWGRELTKPINRMKRYQDLLGGRHDCAVWLELLDDFTARSGGALTNGVKILRADRQMRHRKLYDDFHRFHRACQKEEFWESLYRTIRSNPQRPSAQKPHSQGR